MVSEQAASYDGFVRQEDGDKFAWNSQTMMPDVIATRAKVNYISG